MLKYKKSLTIFFNNNIYSFYFLVISEKLEQNKITHF